MPVFVTYGETDPSAADVTTVTVTMTSSGSARLALLILHINSAKAALDMTVGGSAATSLGNANNAYVWYFVNPPEASTAYVATWTTAARVVMRVLQIREVNQADPLRVLTANSGTSTAPTITGTSAVGELVIDVLNLVTSNQDSTPGAGQTQIADAFYAGLSRSCAESWQLGEASTVMDWTIPTSNAWDNAFIAIRPAAVGNQAIWFYSKIRDFYRDLRAGLIPADELRKRYGELITI